VALRVAEYAKSLKGRESVCVSAFAQAFEVIPYTLAENAGLNPIAIVTDLRNRHATDAINDGINVRNGTISDMKVENVLQPLLVCSSAISLATETVVMLLKIDDIVATK